MHFLSLASIALVASGASAIVVPRSHVHHARHSAEKPDTYYEGYLEPYATYHTRYLALSCENFHGKPFFDLCCHPLLATETLAKNRDAQCNPANQVTSSVSAASTAAHTTTASSAAPAATQVLSTGGDDVDDEDCDDEDDEPTSSASSAAPTATSDEDDEDCEDEDDETSSAVAQPTTHAASSTHASSTHAPATTSTEAPAPVTTHSTTPSSTPTPTTTKSTPTSTKSTSSPTATSGSGNSGSGTFTGNATFYYQNGQAGACGAVNPDTALIAAMQTARYGNLGAKSSLCGKQVEITNTKNGKKVTVTIADACPTCETADSIDLSSGAFTQIATKEEGEVPISWRFV